MKKAEEKIELAHEATRKLEESMKKVLEEKMQMEIHLADVSHEHKINADATRMKMRKIKRYALGKEICLHYAIDAIVILVAIFIAMSGFFRCMR